MGSDSDDKRLELIENLCFLLAGIRNQIAVWSDFHLKTNLSKPFLVLIEPTLRCPMHCKFCDLPSDNTYPKEVELSLPQWKRILKEVQAFSGLIRDIFISGGEPFLRDDMCDILEHAHDLGLGTRLVTIGAFCNKEICDRLISSPPNWLKFSVHSARPSVHDWLVGAEVFEKAIATIEYLVSHEYGGRIGLLTTVWRGNVRELADIARLASQLGVDGVFYRPLFGNTRAVRRFGEAAPVHPDCKIRDYQTALTAVDELKQLKHQGYPISNTERQLDLIVEHVKGTNQGVPGCRMMYESIYIRPNGDVEACGHMSLGTIGNVANRKVESVLTAPGAYRIRHSVSRACKCQGNAFVRKTLREKISIAASVVLDNR